jgi:carboxypeptidase Taq
MGILGWDTQTGMPEKASEYRSEVDSYLYGLYFEKKIGPKIQEAIDYFGQHPEELSEVGTAAYQLVKEEYELQKNVPNELAIEASAATSRAHTAWTKARKPKIFLCLKMH